MSTQVEILVESPVSTSEKVFSKPVPLFFRIGIAAILTAGFLPLLSWFLYGLLEKPHYQFAILIPLAAWLLSLSEIQIEHKQNSWRNRGFMCSLMFLSLAGLGVAVRLWSPWLAAISFLVMFPALIWLLGGMEKVYLWIRGWILSWTMIPLPFGLDQDLIVALRSITTRLSSKVLDQFEILHLQYGNVIEVPGKQLFIADACSGIHSLYVLLSAALFIGLWLKRGVIHILLLLVGAFFLVLVENIMRIILIAGTLKYQVDLSSGIEHTLLGGGLFVSSLLILVSLDQLICFILTSKIMDQQESWIEKKQTQQPNAEQYSLGKTTISLFIAGAVVAGVLGIFQVYQSKGSIPDFAGLSYEEITLPEFGKQGLPSSINGFQQTDYKTIDRVPGDPFGQASQQWTYQKEGMTVLLALDYPYDGVHDLCVCYSNIGWKITDQRVLNNNEVQLLSSDESSPIAVGKLTRDLYGNGLLAFSFFDRQGEAAAVIKSLVKRPSEQSWKDRFGEKNQTHQQSSPKALSPPYVQIQILARNSEPVGTSEEEELLRFFIQARKQLTQMCLDHIHTSQKD